MSVRGDKSNARALSTLKLFCDHNQVTEVVILSVSESRVQLYWFSDVFRVLPIIVDISPYIAEAIFKVC